MTAPANALFDLTTQGSVTHGLHPDAILHMQDVVIARRCQPLRPGDDLLADIRLLAEAHGFTTTMLPDSRAPAVLLRRPGDPRIMRVGADGDVTMVGPAGKAD